jgi:hypothetical protein
MRFAVPTLLATLAVAFAGGILYETIAPLDPVEVTPFHPAPGPVRLAQPPAAPPPDAFADIDARPLFSMTRQPLADTSGLATTAGADFILVGVISGGDKAVALLKNRTTSQSFSAVVGGVVDGWRVAKIDPTVVTLRSATGSIDVGLEAPGSGPPSAPISPLQPVHPPVATLPATTAATATPAPPAANPTPTAAAPSQPPATYKPTIAPEALRGAPRDPKTGEPTL